VQPTSSQRAAQAQPGRQTWGVTDGATGRESTPFDTCRSMRSATLNQPKFPIRNYANCLSSEPIRLLPEPGTWIAGLHRVQYSRTAARAACGFLLAKGPSKRKDQRGDIQHQPAKFRGFESGPGRVVQPGFGTCTGCRSDRGRQSRARHRRARLREVTPEFGLLRASNRRQPPATPRHERGDRHTSWKMNWATTAWASKVRRKPLDPAGLRQRRGASLRARCSRVLRPAKQLW